MEDAINLAIFSSLVNKMLRLLFKASAIDYIEGTQIQSMEHMKQTLSAMSDLMSDRRIRGWLLILDAIGLPDEDGDQALVAL